MLFVEYAKYGDKKSINLAMCYEIEVAKNQTSSHGYFAIKLKYPGGSAAIEFKTEEHLDKAFESLMNALRDSETRHWKVPDFDKD